MRKPLLAVAAAIACAFGAASPAEAKVGDEAWAQCVWRTAPSRPRTGWAWRLQAGRTKWRFRSCLVIVSSPSVRPTRPIRRSQAVFPAGKASPALCAGRVRRSRAPPICPTRRSTLQILCDEGWTHELLSGRIRPGFERRQEDDLSAIFHRASGTASADASGSSGDARRRYGEVDRVQGDQCCREP